MFSYKSCHGYGVPLETVIKTPANGCFLLQGLYNTPLCICSAFPLCIHLSMSRHQANFSVMNFPVLNSARMNVGKCILSYADLDPIYR